MKRSLTGYWLEGLSDTHPLTMLTLMQNKGRLLFPCISP
jgi:hypothetical protein